MKNWWIKLGCFLIGYNYQIVSHSSEISAKIVKRYTSAVLIVCLIWAFVGFTFTQRYLGAGFIGTCIGGVIAVVIVVQIERQIILTINPTKWLYLTRFILAVLMATIGSLVIDQIIFQKDIELKKLALIDDKVNEILPKRTKELKDQINALDTAILSKENERGNLMNDITKNPTIKSVTSTSTPLILANSTTDSLHNTKKNEHIIKVKSTTIKTIQNPKMGLITPLDQQIDKLRILKENKDSILLALRPQVEQEIKEKSGFLDELKVMVSILKSSKIAFGVYLLWFLFLLMLEMLVVLSKWNQKKNDYDETLENQLQLHIHKLNIMSRNSK